MCLEPRDGGSSFPQWLAHDLRGAVQPLGSQCLVWRGLADQSFIMSGLSRLTGHSFVHSANNFELLLSVRHHSQRASQVAQMVKNLPTMLETWVRSLGQRGPLEKRMATDSSFLAWEIPWSEEPSGPHSMGVAKELDTI